MVDPKRSSRGVKGSLHPLTAAALSALPPLGYKAPPTLIGFKTIDPSVIALRIKHYNRAYKTLSVNSWNTYVSFGIQDFVGPDEYYSHKETESIVDGNLRLARYYRNHLENHAKIDGFLMQTIPAVETALAKSHPGFFDMSLSDMDSYLSQLPTKNEDTPMELDLPTEKNNHQKASGGDAEKKISSLATAAFKSNDDSSPSPPPVLLSTQDDSVNPFLTHQPPLREPPADAAIFLHPTGDVHQGKKVTHTDPPISGKASSLPKMTSQHPSPHVKRPTLSNKVVRIEVRWAPRDFQELRMSSTKLHLRLAPILSCFNNEHTWMMEWQTDQMDESSDIAPSNLSKYLGIRFVPVAKEQCFYFSFRIHGSGSQFSKAAASKVISIAKRGEHMTFDPSSIPASQGELMFVGDILLKDASVTQRGKYLQNLRKEVLPHDTPAFDIKLRHSNPTGSRITILTVRSGKSQSTRIAEIFSNALCGEGNHPEIFISRLALGANQTSKQDHERIHKVHNDFLADASHLLFSASTAIGTAVTEFLDSGETILRSPRQWAKSLKFTDGGSLEVDLENGGAHDGKAVLVVPSASLLLAKMELQQYWTRRNPILSHAVKLYKVSKKVHRHIRISQ